MAVLMRTMVAGSVRDRDRMVADGTVDWYLDLDLARRRSCSTSSGSPRSPSAATSWPGRGSRRCWRRRRADMWLLTLRDLQYRRLRVIVVVLLAAS